MSALVALLSLSIPRLLSLRKPSVQKSAAIIVLS